MHANWHPELTRYDALNQRKMLFSMFCINIEGEITLTGGQSGFDEILDHKKTQEVLEKMVRV